MMPAAEEGVHTAGVPQRDPRVKHGAGDGVRIERHRGRERYALEAVAVHPRQTSLGEHENRAALILIDRPDAIRGQTVAPRVRSEAAAGKAREAAVFRSCPKRARAILE